MLTDAVLCPNLSDFTSVKEDIESSHATLPGDPRDTRLAVELKGHNLGRYWEIGLDESIEHRPEHLGLRTREADPEGVADSGAGAISCNGVLGLDLAAKISRHGDALVRLLDAGDVLGVVYAGADLLEPLRQDPLDHGLADHEEVLVQAVLEAHPPLILAGFPLSLAKG